MTYQDFRRMVADATEHTSLDGYIADVGGSVPLTVPDDALTQLLTACWDYGHERTMRTIRRIAGLSQAQFAAAYSVPRRTVENWESGSGTNTRTAPPYVLDMLAYVAVSDLIGEVQ